jgi:hypothetical protein
VRTNKKRNSSVSKINNVFVPGIEAVTMSSLNISLSLSLSLSLFLIQTGSIKFSIEINKLKIYLGCYLFCFLI